MTTEDIPNAGTALRSDQNEDNRRTAAAVLGSARSERKRASSAENGKLGGRPEGFEVSEETRQKQAEAIRAAWERKRAAGETFAKGKKPRELEEIPCNCEGEGLNHKSTCARGRAIRRRQKAGTL